MPARRSVSCLEAQNNLPRNRFGLITLAYAYAATEVVLRLKRFKATSMPSLPAWWCVRAAAWLVFAILALKPFVRAFEGKVSDQVARGLANHVEVLLVVVARTRDRRALLGAQAACVAARGPLRAALEAYPLVAWGAFFVATADAFGLVSWAVDAIFGTAMRAPALVARTVLGGDDEPAKVRGSYTCGTLVLAGLWFAIGASLDTMLDTQGHTKEEILAFIRLLDDDHDH